MAKAGIDDLFAAGQLTVAALRGMRQRFEPVDVGAERLGRDESLSFAVEELRRLVGELPARKATECNAVKVARFLVGAAAEHGKLQDRGVKVRPSLRQIGKGVRLGSLQTVSKALVYLETVGFLEHVAGPRGPHEAASYLLLYPSQGGSAQSVHKGTMEAEGAETQQHGEDRVIPLYKRGLSRSVHSTHIEADRSADAGKLPALRNSKLVHTWARKNGRRVVVDSDYFKRYGSKREEIVRYVLEHGGADERELWERFGSRTSRIGRFVSTWIDPIVEDGVLVRDAFDGAGLRAAPDWTEALERVRERTDEEQDNRLQDRKYAEQSRAYRRAKYNPTEPTPELAGPERAAEIVAEAEKRDHAARVEEQRRKVGMTAEVFLADALRDASGFGWRELRALWMARGGRPDDLRRAVTKHYRFEGGEYGGQSLYVTRRDAPAPVREPARVSVLREPETKPRPARPPKTTHKVYGEDVYDHGPFCDCELCDTPIPTRYARAYTGSAS